MRYSVLAILPVVALLSAATATATAANEDEDENQLRSRVLNEQQLVSLQVNLAANCQVETTQ
jgi:hypothetical protein